MTIILVRELLWTKASAKSPECKCNVLWMQKKCQLFLNETDLLLFFVVYDTVSSGLLVGQKNPF